MCAIGHALMGGPRLVLIDEASLGLATILVTRVFAAIETLVRDGIAIVLVEQNAPPGVPHRGPRVRPRSGPHRAGRVERRPPRRSRGAGRLPGRLRGVTRALDGAGQGRARWILRVVASATPGGMLESGIGRW